MVKGLDIFRAHFQEFTNRYVLIGGTACDIAMTGAGLEFRATKDLDIVLVVEALDADFVRAFWEFVRAGGYQLQEKSTGQKQFYRFQKPTNEAYPFMLELFSRQPDALPVAEGSHLTPVPVDEDLSSLSAILMDEDYYRFVMAGRDEIDGLPVLDAAHLLPLKARAWLDLTRREKNGEQADNRVIKKHKNDVFRLIAKRGVNALILVHRRQLQEQWIDRLSTFLGLPSRSIGRIGGGKRKLTGLLDVAVIQSLGAKAWWTMWLGTMGI